MTTPAALQRWDRDGDGELDDEEWATLRAVIDAAVVHDLDDAETTADPAESSGANPEAEWTIEDEVDDPSIEMPVLEVIDERYEVLREISHGSHGRTYLARRRRDAHFVVVKELPFEKMGSWKELELFEREATALRAIDHPCVPRFFDSFYIDTDASPRFFLVQDFVSGDGLDTLIARGHRWSENEIVAFARQMLDTLDVLHNMNPPIVHRDVKPSNIIRTGKGYSLVDFGAVQLVAQSEGGGSTVVGTSGYMPPEQFAGRAVPGSDLYGLGATMVHMLTHIHPYKLPQHRLKLSWRNAAPTATAPLGAYVDKLIHPVVEDRFESAREARAALDSLGGAMVLDKQKSRRKLDPQSLDFGRPQHADATIRFEGEGLMVDMSQSMLAPRLICMGLGLCVGAVLMVILVDWTWLVVMTVLGLVVSEAWSGGPDQTLHLSPGRHFLLVHRDRTSRRETSGQIHRLTLDGTRLHIQTDSGKLVSVGAHCSAPTRRWVFAKVDDFLRTT